MDLVIVNTQFLSTLILTHYESLSFAALSSIVLWRSILLQSELQLVHGVDTDHVRYYSIEGLGSLPSLMPGTVYIAIFENIWTVMLKWTVLKSLRSPLCGITMSLPNPLASLQVKHGKGQFTLSKHPITPWISDICCLRRAQLRYFSPSTTM